MKDTERESLRLAHGICLFQLSYFWMSQNESLVPETSAKLENSKWRSEWNSGFIDENAFQKQGDWFILTQTLELEKDSTISSKSNGLLDEEYDTETITQYQTNSYDVILNSPARLGKQTSDLKITFEKFKYPGNRPYSLSLSLPHFLLVYYYINNCLN